MAVPLRCAALVDGCANGTGPADLPTSGTAALICGHALISSSSPRSQLDVKMHRNRCSQTQQAETAATNQLPPALASLRTNRIAYGRIGSDRVARHGTALWARAPWHLSTGTAALARNATFGYAEGASEAALRTYLPLVPPRAVALGENPVRHDDRRRVPRPLRRADAERRAQPRLHHKVAARSLTHSP